MVKEGEIAAIMEFSQLLYNFLSSAKTYPLSIAYTSKRKS